MRKIFGWKKIAYLSISEYTKKGAQKEIMAEMRAKNVLTQLCATYLIRGDIRKLAVYTTAKSCEEREIKCQTAGKASIQQFAY